MHIDIRVGIMRQCLFYCRWKEFKSRVEEGLLNMMGSMQAKLVARRSSFAEGSGGGE